MELPIALARHYPPLFFSGKGKSAEEYAYSNKKNVKITYKISSILLNSHYHVQKTAFSTKILYILGISSVLLSIQSQPDSLLLVLTVISLFCPMCRSLMIFFSVKSGVEVRITLKNCISKAFRLI